MVTPEKTAARLISGLNKKKIMFHKKMKRWGMRRNKNPLCTIKERENKTYRCGRPSTRNISFVQIQNISKEL